jgi:hypothetical protein
VDGVWVRGVRMDKALVSGVRVDGISI